MYKKPSQCFSQRENRLRESLQTFITLHKARVVQCTYYISLEAGVETKLYPDSAFGNSLSTSDCKPKSEKSLFFSGPPMPLEIELLQQG